MENQNNFSQPPMTPAPEIKQEAELPDKPKSKILLKITALAIATLSVVGIITFLIYKNSQTKPLAGNIPTANNASINPTETQTSSTSTRPQEPIQPAEKKLLSDQKLNQLPPVAQDISNASVFIQTIQKPGKPGAFNFMAEPAIAAENSLSRVIVYEKGPRPRDIYWYDMEYATEKKLTANGKDNFYPALNKDGYLVYFTNAGQTGGNYSRDIIQANLLDVNQKDKEKELAKGEQLFWYPFISPSGKLVAIIDGFNSVTVAKIPGGSSKKYTVTSPGSSNSGMGAISWSKDENKIIFQLMGTSVGGKYNMSIAELDLNSEKVSMVVDTPTDEVVPQYIDNGRISYLENKETLDQTSFHKTFTVLQTSTGEKQQFQLDQGVRQTYLWSPDYKYVYFLTKEGYISMLRIETGEYWIANNTNQFSGFVGWNAYPESILMSKFNSSATFPCYDIYSGYNISNKQPLFKAFDTCPK